MISVCYTTFSTQNMGWSSNADTGHGSVRWLFAMGGQLINRGGRPTLRPPGWRPWATTFNIAHPHILSLLQRC